MARPIVLSNSELHVGLDEFGLVNDFYFPYVGLENHSAGKQLTHRIGVWCDNYLSWLDDGTWRFEMSYPGNALVGRTVAVSNNMGITIELDDFVDSDICAFIRNIKITNNRDYDREIRIFMYQAFIIGDSYSATDTAQYLPDSNAILHYRGRRAFIISGDHNNQPFDQYAIGLFGIEGHDGTYRDAEDGALSLNSVEHGRVDSILRFLLKIKANDSDKIDYWIAAGTSTREALDVHKKIKEDTPAVRLANTVDWWNDWLRPAIKFSESIEEPRKSNFIKNVMILRSQIDKRGAVIASTDTTMLNYSRDAYAYCWPRDGALAIWPLIRLGYTKEPYRFFTFCRRGMHNNGYLMHKYRSDGALGSSWHSYIHNYSIAPPIQVDETALVLFMFAQYYQVNSDASILNDFYDTMIKPMATFLSSYINSSTGLPQPSYDLWEEVFMTTTFTTATVYAALLAASDLAAAYNKPDDAIKWRSTAEDIQTAAHRHLFNEKRQYFYKGINVDKKHIINDETIDTSALFGAYVFGLFSLDDFELKASLKTLTSSFQYGVDNKYGLPRYENDHYYRAGDSITGNWWIITSLWLAQYYINTGEVDQGSKILSWVENHMMSTGVLSEQINPYNDNFISVAPLTWSQAEYISSILDLITANKK